MSKIAFLGLGAMGCRMARRLLDAGHEVTVWNRTPARAEELAGLGAACAATPRAAVKGAGAVIAMVTGSSRSDSIENVLLKPNTAPLLRELTRSR